MVAARLGVKVNDLKTHTCRQSDGASFIVGIASMVKRRAGEESVVWVRGKAMMMMTPAAAPLAILVVHDVVHDFRLVV